MVTKANDKKSGTTWLVLRNLVEGCYSLHWLLNLLTLQDIFYIELSQYVMLFDIKCSKRQVEQTNINFLYVKLHMKHSK